MDFVANTDTHTHTTCDTARDAPRSRSLTLHTAPPRALPSVTGATRMLGYSATRAARPLRPRGTLTSPRTSRTGCVPARRGREIFGVFSNDFVGYIQYRALGAGLVLTGGGLEDCVVLTGGFGPI